MVENPDPDDLGRRVIAAVAAMQRKPAESVALESTFQELGIDSLNGFQLLCDLEEDLGITIPDDEARELRTLRDVVDRIRPLLASRS
jgi:acyl carrier protein